MDCTKGNSNDSINPINLMILIIFKVKYLLLILVLLISSCNKSENKFSRELINKEVVEQKLIKKSLEKMEGKQKKEESESKIVENKEEVHQEIIEKQVKEKVEDDEENVGIDIMRRALEEPIRQICENAGAESSIVAQAVREGKADYGYDARNGEYVNMLKAGIIDPTKVARVAVQNATSIAGMILTTEAAVTELPEKDGPPMPPMDPGMGGMGGMM